MSDTEVSEKEGVRILGMLSSIKTMRKRAKYARINFFRILEISWSCSNLGSVYLGKTNESR